MNKDRVEGKLKDVAGRAERQVGEWTDDPKKQAEGAAKQISGKAQNAWGKAKDAASDAASPKPAQSTTDDSENDTAENRRSKA